MCGIVGAVARRDVVPFLLEGLRRVEYRGYDSAGIAVMTDGIDRLRTVGKVAELEALVEQTRPHGSTGIAHTRWATHGKPDETNAHPLMCGEEVAVVHNGIIENHADIRTDLLASGYRFDSETDTEVIGHRIHHDLARGDDLFEAVRKTVLVLEGSYAFGVMAMRMTRIVSWGRSGAARSSWGWVRASTSSPPTWRPSSGSPASTRSSRMATSWT